jgi:hypothetical protein
MESRRGSYDRGLRLRYAGRVESNQALKYRKHVGLSRSITPFLPAAAVFLFAFVCFLPNPALPIGGNTGLQAGQIMALLSLPVALLMSGLPTRQTLVSLVLLLPVLLSCFLVVLTDRAISNEVVFKSTVATALVFVVLVPAGKVVNKRYTMSLLSGVAWAVVLNAVVGFYQAYRFAQDELPLAGLYQNPSFNNFMNSDPERYALYVKRPFGLFPEPSAMAASIGPWLILFVGLLLYPKLRREMTRGALARLLLAVVCGLGLIIMSRSGYTIWLLAGLVLVILPYLKRHVLRLYRPGSLFVLMALVLVGAALVALSVAHVGSRLDIQENSSWSARLASIVWSFTYLGTSLGNMLYGVGSGQSYLILQSTGSSSLPAASFGGLPVDAVWSVVVGYILETGLLGALALALVLIMVMRAIVRSSARLVGFSCLGAWLAGVVFTTSYLPLLPIWLLLGVLLGWDRIFQPRATANGLGPKAGAPSVRKAVKM